MQIIDTQATHRTQEDLFGLRCILILIALLEGLEAILDLPLLVDRPNLLYGPWAEVPTTSAGVFLAKAHVAAHPLLAIAALTLTMVGNARAALIALAAISVVTWLSFLPVVLQDGLPFQSGWDIQWTVAQLFVFPLLAGMAIALAALTRRYTLAAVLVAIPTGYNAFGMVLFVVNVIAANI